MASKIAQTINHALFQNLQKRSVAYRERVTLINRYPLWFTVKRVWRYQRCNQNPYIEEEQDNTMAKRKSTQKHTLKTKDRVTRTPIKPGG